MWEKDSRAGGTRREDGRKEKESREKKKTPLRERSRRGVFLCSKLVCGVKIKNCDGYGGQIYFPFFYRVGRSYVIVIIIYYYFFLFFSQEIFFMFFSPLKTNWHENNIQESIAKKGKQKQENKNEKKNKKNKRRGGS